MLLCMIQNLYFYIRKMIYSYKGKEVNLSSYASLKNFEVMNDQVRKSFTRNDTDKQRKYVALYKYSKQQKNHYPSKQQTTKDKPIHHPMDNIIIRNEYIAVDKNNHRKIDKEDIQNMPQQDQCQISQTNNKKYWNSVNTAEKKHFKTQYYENNAILQPDYRSFFRLQAKDHHNITFSMLSTEVESLSTLSNAKSLSKISNITEENLQLKESRFISSPNNQNLRSFRRKVIQKQISVKQKEYRTLIRCLSGQLNKEMKVRIKGLMKVTLDELYQLKKNNNK